jgi:hypothetical protein
MTGEGFSVSSSKEKGETERESKMRTSTSRTQKEVGVSEARSSLQLILLKKLFVRFCVLVASISSLWSNGGE